MHYKGWIFVTVSVFFLLIFVSGANQAYAETKLVTNGTIQIGSFPSGLPNTSFRISTGTLNVATVSAISPTFVGSASTTLSPTTGWTQIQSVSADDANQKVTFGFNTSFNTTSYNGVYVSSNTYLTFGSGSSLYSALAANVPAIPGVHLCAADNSYQRVWYKLDNASTMRIRYEGNNSTSGTPGSPTIIYEAVFYSGQSYFDVNIGVNSRCAGDTTPPTISNVTSSKTNGTYTTGEVIPIAVTFSEAVTSTGNVTVTLETGATDRTCTFTVSNSTTGSCNYTVQAGDTASDLTVNSLSGTIKDAANNSMANFTPSTNLAANKALVIDTTGPTVSNVTSPQANGSYKSGDILSIQVVFNEVATVSGTPKLVLLTGSPTTTSVNYASGSGTTTLYFTYTVASSNITSDLDYGSTGALTLSGGSISDTVGNAATMTLPSPGASGSLGANKNIAIDNSTPTVTLTSSAPSLTNAAIPVTATFSEAVTGFVVGDISVTNGIAGSFSGTGTTYTFTVTPTGSGTVTITVPVSSAQDSAGNGNTVSNTVTKSYDNVAPTVTITTAVSSPTLQTPIPFTATFSEAVSDFTLSDIIATNSAVGNFQAVSSTVYTFDISPVGHPTLNVDVTLSVLANMVHDAATNGNTASSVYSLRFDNHSPTVSLTTNVTELTNAATIPVTAIFSESVTGFDAGDLVLTNGTAGNFSGSGTTYTFDITPGGQGAVTIRIPANISEDAAHNQNLVSNLLSRTSDNVSPTVVVSTSAASPFNSASFSVTATFSEAVTGFVVGDLSLTNGSASSFTSVSTTVYTFEVTPSGQGAVTVSIPVSSAQDGAANQNTVSNTISRTFDSAGPILSEVTPISSPTSDDTPSYTFSSSETGTITYGGDCSSSTTSASSGNNTVTFSSLSEGIHNSCTIQMTDALGNVSLPLVVTDFTTYDPTGPILSAVTALPSITTATITWTSNEIASSVVEYGLVPAYGFVTSETDTSPRVLSHSVNISSLKTCARYFYRVISTDASTNETTSSAYTFKTTGCEVSSITTGSEEAITTVSGGEVELVNGSTTATITIPSNFSTGDASFQLNQLETSTPPVAPSGKSLAGSNLYELLAVDGSGTPVTSFDVPITFTISYGSTLENTYLESTLDVYRYSSGTWDDKDCTLDTTANTLTCTLSSFSTYGIFGTAIATVSESSSGSSAGAPSSSARGASCSDSKPIGSPDLFQIDRTETTAKLYFTPVTSMDHYYISYSTNDSAEEHGIEVTLGSMGVQNYRIQSLSKGTTYYFKVRAQNGCMPGDWSNTKQTVTVGQNNSLISPIFAKTVAQIKKTVALVAPEKKVKIVSSKLTAKKSHVCSYIVQSGDSLWRIAADKLENGSRFTDIQSLNKLSSTSLSVGTELQLPCDEKPDTLVKAQEEKKIEGIALDVKVLAMNNQPIEGAVVTLHSKVQTAKTDKQGIAHFENVEKGDHKVVLSYKTYSGEQSLKVSGKNTQELLTLQVQLKQSFSWVSLTVIGIMAVIIGYLLFLLRKKRKNE